MLVGLNVHAQIKPILPKRPHLLSKAVKASSPNYTPYGYIQVGNTDLCYYNGSSYIDVKGYFNGNWYRSTYSDGGYRVAISVTKREDSTEEPDLFGSYTVNSWRGHERYWYNGEYIDEYYIGDDYYTAQLTNNGDNTVKLSNFATFGGSVIGTINREDHTIIFPAQSIYMDNWEVSGLFCKQTDELVDFPIEENAITEVVATYDDNFNITMDGWAILVTYDDERLIYDDNTLSMSKNSSGPDGAYTAVCEDGGIYDGVRFSSSVEQQGELARICYAVTNTNKTDVVVSLGTHADVMIGSNDSAPIERRIDTFGQTYGLTMKDGNGAQLCVLFGSGLAGVTAVSDFWFGGYYTNYEAYQMVGNYSPGDNYMVENGYYDSGMGWCWKERTITAGSTVVFSYVIGVGEVNLEPNSSFEVTPDDPEGWNDLSRPHRLTLNGSYESPAGLDGIIDYAVEDSEDWIALTDTLASGDEFTGSLVAMFDATKSTHVIKFRTRDLVGNTTLLHPIEYVDVSFHTLTGIEEKTYTGDSLFQTNITCDLDEDQFELKTYRNNVNAGIASFNLEGVFPYTIGRKTYTFTIHPQQFTGDVVLDETSFIYNGQPFTPDWQFTNADYANLEYDKDYTLSWSNNTLPGTGTLTVTGKNNYTGSLVAGISIDKAQLTDNLFTLTLPDEDITYDEQSHGAFITKTHGVGNATISYLKTGETETTTTQPSEAGDYIIYLEFADGALYYGREKEQVGTFTIYEFSAEEWATLQTILPKLTEMGWSQPWNVSQGVKSVSSLHGLVIEKGHVTGLNLSSQNLSGMFPSFLLNLPQLHSLNVANNHLRGNIGLYSSSFANLTSLDASGNCFDEVTPMLPSTLINVNLGNQTIDKTIELNLSNLSAEYLIDKVPNILLYNHAGQSYSSNIRLLCVTSDETWSMRLISQNGQINLTAVSEDNAFRGQSGDRLNVAVIKNNGSREGSTFRINLSFDEGDSNFDGKVNILDLQTTLNYMFEEYTNKPYNFTASNLWKDEVINVQDAVCLVNMLLDATTPARQLNTTRKVAAQASSASASVFIENGYLTINSAVPVSAFDIMVSTNQQVEIVSALNDMGFTCTSLQSGNVLHLVGYSLNGVELPAGETAICKLNSGTVSYAMLADRDANEISVSQNSGTTTAVQSSMFNPSSQEVYRIPLGAKRAIIIDTIGRKTLIKDEK